MTSPKTTVLLITLIGSAVCIASAQQPRRVDDDVLKNAGKTGEGWLTYGQTPGETRFSPLTQINTSNVQQLGLAWFYDVGPGGGLQGTPLVWNDTLYGITNWSVVFAVDGRTGKERWRWNPDVNQAAVLPQICCGVVSRGLAVYQGMIIAPVIDGRLQALDADTGRPVWEARVAYPQEHFTITMAPRIAQGKVIIGVSGSDFPTRGYVDAYDAVTGRRAWRFYTVPGDPSKGFENSAMRKAADTWEGEWWKLGGGGAVWDGVAYDPDERLIYVGTGNAYPRFESLRGGKDNLYTASILAIHVETGELRWHYQVVPGDAWDYDAVQQMILTELRIAGRSRKVIMQASKNGFFYVLDRVTGQFISAQPFAQVTWAKGIDPATGRPIVNTDARYGGEPIIIRPGGSGAHNTSPMSFNPISGLVYIPTTANGRYTYFVPAAFDPRLGDGQISVRGITPTLPEPPAIGPPPPEWGVNALVAWDPVTQQMRWRVPGGGGIGGGTVTTAANLVFQSSGDALVAHSADKGEILMVIPTGLGTYLPGQGPPIMGPPITYQIGGQQYVAVMGGTGLPAGQAPPVAPRVSPHPPKLLTYTLNPR